MTMTVYVILPFQGDPTGLRLQDLAKSIIIIMIRCVFIVVVLCVI